MRKMSCSRWWGYLGNLSWGFNRKELYLICNLLIGLMSPVCDSFSYLRWRLLQKVGFRNAIFRSLPAQINATGSENQIAHVFIMRFSRHNQKLDGVEKAFLNWLVSIPKLPNLWTDRDFSWLKIMHEANRIGSNATSWNLINRGQDTTMWQLRSFINFAPITLLWLLDNAFSTSCIVFTKQALSNKGLFLLFSLLKFCDTFWWERLEPPKDCLVVLRQCLDKLSHEVHGITLVSWAEINTWKTATSANFF